MVRLPPPPPFYLLSFVSVSERDFFAYLARTLRCREDNSPRTLNIGFGLLLPSTRPGIVLLLSNAHAPVAFRMAATIRGYVPHRQMLPCINCRISASVGSGLLFSSETADIIIPEVQKAHCIASSSRKACCTGCRRSPFARPSIVVIDLPETVDTGVSQERVRAHQ